MNNIIVTGGSGYIGSHVVKALNDYGFTPVIIDRNYDHTEEFRKRHGLPSLGKGLNIDCGFDFSDKVLEITKGEVPTAIIHLAGSIDVAESVREPLKYLDNNTANTIHVMRCVEKMGIKNIIFSSTAAVYGSSDKPLEEDKGISPSNPYGMSKWLCEEAIRTSSLNHIIFRFFNASGANCDSQMGENHDPETHLIPRVLDSIEKGAPVTIFGTDYSTPDGTCIRDYVHVSDIAEAHVLALYYLLKGGVSDTINLGSGNYTSVSEIVKAAESVTGKEANRKYFPRRDGDPAILLADYSKATGLLGWQPQSSKINTIIRDAWNWYKRIN